MFKASDTYFLTMDDTKVIDSLDTFYSACMDLRKHNYDRCIESCTIILSKNPYDQVSYNYFNHRIIATVNYYYISSA